MLRKSPAKFDADGNITKLPNAINCRHNLALILEGDPKYDTLAYCEHSDRLLFHGDMIEPAQKTAANRIGFGAGLSFEM